jgi:deoxyhypusine monooxygenase
VLLSLVLFVLMSESAAAEYCFSIPSLDELQASIGDECAPIAKRMRSCFLLKQLGGAEAVQALASGLYSSSVLLGHECAYVMGQLQDPLAAAALSRCLQDRSAHPIVRHECAEALANIGLDESLPLLERMTHDDCSEVAETAAIAVEKMRELRQAAAAGQRDEAEEGAAPASKYASVDPAPPLPCRSVPALQQRLCDGSLSLYERYRAMFALRNIDSEEAVAALTAALPSSSSPVFRHELCYVLGQMQHPAALPCLQRLLADRSEHAMVRHEAAEAIGSIAEDWNNDEHCTALQQPEDEGEAANDCTDRRRLTADIAVTRAA